VNEPHILLVEDDVSTRVAMALVLEFEGYQVVAVENGQQALDHLRRAAPPCVILLDLMMPLLDGWGFRDQQQRDPALAAIPLIVLSGDGSVKHTAAFQEAAGFLQKPVDIDKLLASVRRHCQRPTGAPGQGN
jgi:CheY-like chemotaxis protein